MATHMSVAVEVVRMAASKKGKKTGSFEEHE